MPRLEQARIDPLALLFTIGIALVSSVICGLAPALRASRRDLQGGLRDGGRGVRPAGCATACAAALIVAEVALSLLLLVGAGLLIRSAIALQRTGTGFEPRGVLSARVTLPDDELRPNRRRSRRRCAASARPRPRSRASRPRRFPRTRRWAAAAARNGLVPEGQTPVAANFDRQHACA